MVDLPDQAHFPLILHHLQVLPLIDHRCSPQLLPDTLDLLPQVQKGSVPEAEEALSHPEEEDQAGTRLHLLEAPTLVQAGQAMSLLPGTLQEPMQLKANNSNGTLKL